MRLGGSAAVVVGLFSLGVLPGCGPTEPPPAAEAGVPHAATGMWTLDREGLLASVRKRFGPEGAQTVAHEEAQAQRVGLELELRGDGAFGLRSTALGLQQHIVGRWRVEGKTLRFYHQTVDGKPVTKETVEEASFEEDRIRLPFAETGLSFTLVRR